MDDVMVNKHTTMLIVGKAANDFALKEIAYANDYDEVLKDYGDSDLTKAFKVAQDMGAPAIFLMNLQKPQEYFDVIEIFKQSDFAYVVFASMMLSDTFQDMYSGGRRRSVLAYMMGYIGHNCDSTFVVTDKHASLYEDIDSFLKDMRSVQKTFLGRCIPKADLENLIFVANNLKKYPVANVPLAAAICTSPINEYPTRTDFGEAIFYIDKWDNPGDMAYFRTNLVRETTIENFLNLLQGEQCPEKLVFIDRILKYIHRETDFSEFKGRQYTSYQKLLFSKKLTKYLDSLKGFIIRQYSILSIDSYVGVNNTITMLARIEILPINCLEVCTLKEEVTV